jgi:hypothetical protein
MLPSGSVRPDQPTCVLSIVARRLLLQHRREFGRRIEMSIPASAAIAWMTCISWVCTGLLAACISIAAGRHPASASRALAFPHRGQAPGSRVIPGRGRREGLVARRIDAFEHDLVDDLAVDRQRQRLAHALVLAEGGFRPRAVVHVDGDALIALADRAFELQLGVGLDGAATSDGARRSSMSRSPERRLARRTVVSGIGRKISRSKW